MYVVNMKSVVAVLLCLSTVWSYVKVPNARRCLMTFDDFKNKVVGHNWIMTHFLADKMYDYVFRPLKANIKWTLESDGEREDAIVRRIAAVWNETGAACSYPNSTFASPGSTVASPGSTTVRSSRSTDYGYVPVPRKLDKLRELNGSIQFQFENRFDILYSRNPDKYLIWFVCRDESGISKKKCPRSLTMVMVKDPLSNDCDVNSSVRTCVDRDLSGIPWGLIETNMKSCQGLGFEETSASRKYPTQLNWGRFGPECPLKG